MSRFLDACWRRPVDRPPLWVMRQAGRYLPEYQATRAQAGGFLELCRNPELACEVTLQPIRRYGMDAAIIFSDILTATEPLGVEMSFAPGPVIHNKIESPADLGRLQLPQPWSGTAWLTDAIGRVREGLAEMPGETALIGFCGAPWTLAAYLIEGSGKKDFRAAKAFAWQYPQAFADLLDLLVEAMASYLASQAAAGAQALQVFDTWLGILSPEEAEAWALGPSRRLLAKLEGLGVPRIYFGKGGFGHAEALAAMPCEVLGFDWSVDLATAAAAVPGKAVQGNLDPALLLAPKATIRERTEAMLRSAPKIGHIANLGHGITPEVDPEHLGVFVDTVKGWRFDTA